MVLRPSLGLVTLTRHLRIHLVSPLRPWTLNLHERLDPTATVSEDTVSKVEPRAQSYSWLRVRPSTEWRADRGERNDSPE